MHPSPEPAIEPALKSERVQRELAELGWRVDAGGHSAAARFTLADGTAASLLLARLAHLVAVHGWPHASLAQDGEQLELRLAGAATADGELKLVALAAAASALQRPSAAP